MIISILIVTNVCWLLLYLRQKGMLIHYRSSAIDTLTTHDEMKETLKIGLYHRYKKEQGEDKDEGSLEFEAFVAEMMEAVRGGRTYVTRASRNYGIDIEEHTDHGLYLGLAVCTDDRNPVDYGPIAVVHSQMVKRGAVGGYVATTGEFTAGAYQYADELNIELYNGDRLVDLWMGSEEAQEEELTEFSPAT
ncbi:restriction endonuclease [Paenibacillus sp. VMFN-D1]|uniref:restriction endonuclease n=1 Tax=Paenibacillus sp. VMFN-D1 TaxID=2135608 RepID=UPI000E37F01C|nr:restriction endonuclease [Paenibacillus sp. VMFN-D1]RED40876.1 restriction system protein [Paenibacillus sp. VMFN-D1]